MLERHGVRCVVIGGLAATLHGSGTVTFDVDIVPDPEPVNLNRLSGALGELGARVRVDGIPDGLDFDHSPSALSRMSVLNLVTTFGELDLTFHPAGIPDFADWERGAEEREALGVRFRLASLADVIRSKEAADRAKDRATLPVLRELQARLDRRRDR